MQKIKEETYSEFEEVLGNLKTDIRLTRIMLPSFIFLAIFSRILLKIPIPFSVPIILLVWFLTYFFYPYFFKNKKTPAELYNLYFKYLALDLLFLTLTIHFIGAVEWIGVVFYLLSLGLAGSVLPKKKGVLLSFIAFFLYSSLVLLEYFGFVPHRPLFDLKVGLYREPSYVFPQLLAIAAFFFFISETSGTFSEQLKTKQKQLIKEREKTTKAYKEIEEAKEILEIKVKARTRELERLTEKQEEIIKERTQEIQKRFDELERFRKLAVGRELRMIELKKEIRELKKEIRELKKRD